MIQASPYTLAISSGIDPSELSKHAWIIILHASRIPPHVGILINGSYASLTIKGHELDVKVEALLKLISQKKTEAIAIQLVKQPVFSLDYQKDVFEHFIQQFAKVEPNGATCLSPVKLFLQEFYAVPYVKQELLFEVVEQLKQNGYIYKTMSFNMESKLEFDQVSLPVYSAQELQQVIERETTHSS